MPESRRIWLILAPRNDDFEFREVLGTIRSSVMLAGAEAIMLDTGDNYGGLLSDIAAQSKHHMNTIWGDFLRR